MRILLDHNLNWRLWKSLQSHQVMTTRQMRWEELENGELLKMAQQEFDVMLTTDANLYHQQKVADYDLAVIVLRAYKNSIDALMPMMSQVVDLLDRINPGETHFIYADEALRRSDEHRSKGAYAKSRL